MNDVWERRDSVEPDFTSRKPPTVLEVFKLLPRTNCKECGLPTCMAFAAALAQGDKTIEECPPLLESENKGTVEKLRELGL